MNTSVTLRYDTKTEKLQIVDIFGKVKNITIDTDPDDLKFDDLLSTITIDYIKDLGFETTDNIEEKLPSLITGECINYDEEAGTYSINQDWFNNKTSDYIVSDEGKSDVQQAITVDYLTGLGVVITDTDKDTLYSGQSGIIINDTDHTVFIDHDYLTGYLAGIGYVPHDWDTLYYADEDLLNLNHENNKNTFTVNKEVLSGFISGLLVDNQYVNTQDTPVALSAGEGVDIEVDQENKVNVISFTGHIPSGLKDVWTDEQNINDIKSLGFVLQADQADTQYTAGNGLNLTIDTDTSENVFSVDSQWLSTFVQSFGYLTEESDTTYVGSQSIKITGEENVISVKNAWIEETVGNLITNNLNTNQNQEVIKSFINLDYISGLGFRLDDSDTKYVGSESIKITGDNNTISVKNAWIEQTVNDLITNNLNSNDNQEVIKSFINTDYIKDLGFRLVSEDEDTNYNVVVDGGLTINSNNNFAIDTNWLDNYIAGKEFAQASAVTALQEALENYAQISALPTKVSELDNDAEYITSAAIPTDLSSFTNSPGYLTEHQSLEDYALKADIPTGLNNWKTSDNKKYIGDIGFAQKSEIPTALSEIGNEEDNTNYISGLGFVLASEDRDTKYDVVENGGLTVEDNKFAIDTDWMDNTLEPYAKKEDIPTKVSNFVNDKGYATLADIEDIKLSILQQLNNIVSIISIDDNIIQPSQNLFINNANTLTSNFTCVGKNITVTKLNTENSYDRFISTGDISLNHVTNDGELQKEISNGQYIINTPGRVIITDSKLNQVGYNGIQIGLDSSIEPPKSVLIDGVEFNGTLSNNAISIYGTADDAIITISNCKFIKCSNPIRISNRTNAKVIINLINCDFTEWDNNQYAGIFCCQDYTSINAAVTETNNLFGPEKVVINMINCTHAGYKIAFDDPATICGTGDSNQLIYVYRNKAGGLLAYDPTKFPTISAQ